MIKWDDSLSIGIKVLDDDHKKLLEIINQLSASIETGITRDGIVAVFNDLEEYGVKHFYREESYMKKCDYSQLDEHVLQHKTFVNRIPELKEQLLASPDSSNIHEISTYLTEWLIHHIIHEDMPLMIPFEEHGLSERQQEKSSFFQNIVTMVTNRVSFTKRILFSTLIPLLVMISLSFIVIVNNYNTYNEMKTSSNITQVIYNVNEIIHEIQIERGLSTGYISAKNDKFKESLFQQHSIVDKKIKSFNLKIETLHSSKIAIIQSNIKTFQDDAIYLEVLRKKINLKELSQANAISKYNKIIHNILDITLNIALTNHNIELARHISTLSAISHLKDYMGRERAYGTMIIEQQSATTQEYITFVQIMEAQLLYSHMFEQYATQAYKNLYATILSPELVSQITKYEDHIKSRDFTNLDSKKWFKLMTSKIDNIKILEDKLLDKINTQINKNLQNGMQNLLLWFIVITLILMLTLIIVYLFDYSSKKELNKFTDAMNHLTDGKRSMRLKGTPLKDVLSNMYTSYEVMRQKLLEGDIYTKLFQKQKEIEILYKEIQNKKLEELAFIDPLTGCVNRRKFEELSKSELQRSTRFDSDLSFLMLDIDHFKSVNDTYGHAIGDTVLKRFSKICLDLARDIDVVARIGGEEFVVMLPHTSADGAFMFGERFRKEIYNSEVVVDEQTVKYTVSIGISTLDIQKDTDVSMILQRADLALYEAKNSGRNKCVIYKEEST